MNTGQVLLIIGALVILSFVTLAINSMLVSKTTTIIQSEAHLTAISIAQSMIDEIMTANFDSATVSTATVSKRVYPGQESKLTPTNYLGPEANTSPSEITSVSLPESPDTTMPYQSVTKYNDVDDYNHYTRYYYSPSLGLFGVVDTVYYITYTAPDQKSNTQTFFKKVVVTVRHPNFYPIDQLRSYNPWQGNYYLQLSDVAVYRRYF